MNRLKLRLLIGMVLAMALAWGASPELRAAAKAGAKATVKAAAKVAAAAAQDGKTKKTQKPGQTVKDKKQLVIDRQAAAKKAAVAGFTLAAIGEAAMQPVGEAPYYYTVANWANSPWPITSGNDVVARPTPTDGAANVFVVDTVHPLLASGRLNYFSYFADPAAAGRTFHAYVLRPTAVPNEFSVVYDSGPVTVPATTGAVQRIEPAGDIQVQVGDVIAHYGPGIPINIGGGTDTTYYPANVLPPSSGTIALGAGDYPLFSADRAYSLAANVGGIRKFVDQLPGVPGVTQFQAADPQNRPNGELNNLGQAIPVAVAQGWPIGCVGDACTADYYEIGLVQHREKMHTDLPATLVREYVQLSTPAVQGDSVPLANANVTPGGPATPISGFTGVTAPHFLGPIIVATKDRAVRIKFRNLLPEGDAGDLFLPVDTSYMGAGNGPRFTQAETDPQRPACGQYPKPADCFTENRATLHLHGGLTPWISDGTPHQWITPAAEGKGYPKGVSVRNVPDMGNDCDLPNSGCMTFYYTNQQSARLLFYHDHAWGITRLNVYAGEAAGYLITDPAEQALMAGPLASVGYGIPLIVQDRTFVPDEPQLAATDPLWDVARWGGKGSFWLPHVYMPIQNPDSSDPSGFGRWFYGPWFWPPIVTEPGFGPKPNPHAGRQFDGSALGAACVPGAPCEPATMPGTPFRSSGMEAFHDTPVVNGTVYPTVTLEPKAYRFRVLNAANDRFFNLQWYVADASGTEVALNAQQVADALIDPAGVTPLVDKTLSPKGPDWIQIGTEGGFLPAPVVVPGDQEITYITDPGRFDVGLVDKHSLLLGSAERADVIVDFSQFAGRTLILYNDAPAAFPARDPRYDLYTGNSDQLTVGGPPPTVAGFGPNTRTVMQVKIGTQVSSPSSVSLSALETAFKSVSLGGQGLFENSQHPIIVGQEAYNSAYGTNFLPSSTTGWCNDPASPKTNCDGFARIYEQGGDLFGFNTIASELTKMAIPIQPKGIHDEPNSSSFDEYGRMQATMGVEAPGATPLLQNIILYPYPNPPTELLNGTFLPRADTKVAPISVAADGTQIWKITHNGVDTHPIHFHLYDVQLLNRSPWDGQIIKPPDATELGWKDTVRISPLEDTYVALRPVVPVVPFDLPNSIRLMNPMLPEGSDMRFNNTDVNGNPTTPLLNVPVNFGWEYVWHCHILSHEEMDMMRPQALTMPPNKPVAAFAQSGNNVTVTWTDNSLNETAFVVQRNSGTGWVDRVTIQSPTPDTAGSLLNASDSVTNGVAYTYRLVARNVVGHGGQFPSLTAEAIAETTFAIGTAPNAPGPALTATVLTGPQVRLTFADNARNETAFVIERCTGAACTNFAQIALAPPRNNTGTVNFTDATVTAGNLYRYQVAATNGAGPSTYTSIAEANVATAPAVPAVPAGLTAANGANQGNQRRVVLTWTANTTNVTGFTIERATNSAFTAGLGTTTITNPLQTTVTVTGLARNTYYYFRIKATNTVNSVTSSSGWRNANLFPIRTNP